MAKDNSKRYAKARRKERKRVKRMYRKLGKIVIRVETEDKFS